MNNQVMLQSEDLLKSAQASITKTKPEFSDLWTKPTNFKYESMYVLNSYGMYCIVQCIYIGK